MAVGLTKSGVFLAIVLPVFAWGADFPDPTRPPASIIAPLADGEVEQEQSTGLQSVIISGKRRAAIIDGETVELGGKHGDARLVEVNEGSVVLKGAQGKEVLTMFPGVKMTSRKESKAKPPVAAHKVETGKTKNKPAARKEEK